MFCSISVWVSLVLFCLFLWEGVGALGGFFFLGGGFGVGGFLHEAMSKRAFCDPEKYISQISLWCW